MGMTVMKGEFTHSSLEIGGMVYIPRSAIWGSIRANQELERVGKT